ncbi:hypothetical protein Ocin01_03054 [Orchesella cincta]|uniref:DUF4789 domain-containing protein n=1 Tax=Orchesella cincta TaxID=48709 RepID=A0A1D2NEF6_ORCCI|nr:hypothetical protein Ocin01_03054 [Orchesella cincta]
MAIGNWKPIVFGSVVLVAVILIVALIVHRSLNRDRICENGSELYFEDPVTSEGSCLRSGSQGPCGKNMVITADRSNSSIGVCGCDVNHFERPMVYNQDTEECYFIFTQAFCEDGKWLTITKNQGPMCTQRTCDMPGEELGEWVPLYDGRCVELGKFDNKTCNKSDVIKFHRNKIFPACIHIGTSIGSVGVPSSDCPQGYFSTGLGHCQPPFDFD